jgi:hypothetical protein
MTNVVQIIEGTSFTSTPDSTVGTKVFVDSSALPLLPSTELPSMSSCWDDYWTNVIVNNIKISYLGDDPNCPKKYEVSYNNIDTGFVMIGANSEPATMNITCEFETYKQRTVNTSTGFKYPNGGIIDTEIMQCIMVENYTIHRTINPSTLASFISACIERIGTINNTTFPDASGIPEGLVLFAGVNLEEVVGPANTIKWKAALQFKVKAIGWAVDQGWNLFWNPLQKRYQEPTLNTNKVYNKTDLNILVTEGSTQNISLPPFPGS